MAYEAERPRRDQPSFARRAPAGTAGVAFAELGRRVGLSAPAVAERVGRLERDGVITGYRAVVDPQAIGFPLAAIVRVRPFARQIHKIPELAESTPEVVECERITGEDCFLLRLHVRAIERPRGRPRQLHAVRADDDVDRALLAGAAAVAAFGVAAPGPAVRGAKSIIEGNELGRGVRAVGALPTVRTSTPERKPDRRSAPAATPPPPPNRLFTAPSPLRNRAPTRWRTMTEDARPPRPEPASRRLADGPRAGRRTRTRVCAGCRCTRRPARCSPTARAARRHARALRAALDTSGLRLVLHAPDDLSAGTIEHDRAFAGLLDHAAEAGAELVAYHGLNFVDADGPDRPRAHERARLEEGSFHGHLQRAHTLGVRIAVENLAPVHPSPPRLCHDPLAVRDLVRRLGSPAAGMLLDVGHLHITAEASHSDPAHRRRRGRARRRALPRPRQPRRAPARHRRPRGSTRSSSTCTCRRGAARCRGAGSPLCCASTTPRCCWRSSPPSVRRCPS